MNTSELAAYERALRRLLEVPSSPRLGLERMRELLSRLGDPHLAFRALHVAGTNGKGSVVAFADAMLGAAGVRRGRTTSPHLSCATERIVVGDEPISRERFIALEELVYRAASAMDDAPTFFERVIAMAFRAFADEGVDVAVVEVGLGGRLDATNTVLPRATAVSKVALDHTQFLGDTLTSVAREKAGILKAGIPAVSALQKPEAEAAIRAVADAVGAPLRVLTPEDVQRLEGVRLGFGHGLTARENAALACALVEEAGLVCDPRVQREGLRRARWPGRFERVATNPLVVVDGAHNAHAMEALARGIESDLSLPRPVHVVLGMTRGHDALPFVRELGKLSPASVHVVKARAPRSRPADDLAAEIAGEGLPVTVAGEVGHGLDAATRAAAREGGFVLVTGSLYLVGEARTRLLGVEEDPLLPEF